MFYFLPEGASDDFAGKLLTASQSPRFTVSQGLKHRVMVRCLPNVVSLHSYRYAWAERAKAAGYPERYAQVNLGHNSKAMTRAYSRKAEVQMPSLSEYERQQKAFAEGRIASEPVPRAVNR